MKKLHVAIACLLMAGAAGADTGVGVKLGTLGLGVDVTRAVTDRVSVRGTLNFLNYDRSLTESDVDYDADLRLQSLGVLADWHPWAGGFRVSAGAFANRNRFDLRAKPAPGSTVTLGGQTFDLGTQVESVDADLRFKRVAPYLGIGWGNAARNGNGWSFVADVGALYQRSPRATLTATCGPAAVNTPVCDDIQTRAAQERVELQDSVDDFKWYPVVSVGVAYSF
jgi:hypothetical protein